MYRLEEPSLSTVCGSYVSQGLLAIVHNDSSATALAELSLNTRFQNLVAGKTLVTLEDEGGINYVILSHTWLFTGRYPHWESNTSWDQDPPALSNDGCALKWTRDLFFCNGPKIIPTIPPNSLVLLARDGVPPQSPAGTLFLQQRSTEL